jgi:hypothetical protein
MNYLLIIMADLSLSVRNFNGEKGLESLIYVEGDEISKSDVEKFTGFCFDYIGHCEKDVRVHLNIGRANSPAATCLLYLQRKCEGKNLHVTYPIGKRESYEPLYLVGIDNVVSITEKDYKFVEQQ